MSGRVWWWKSVITHNEGGSTGHIPEQNGVARALKPNVDVCMITREQVLQHSLFGYAQIASTEVPSRGNRGEDKVKQFTTPDLLTNGQRLQD